MKSRPLFNVFLLLLSAGRLAAGAATPQPLVVDLATAGASETRTVARDAEFQVQLQNVMPSKQYGVSVQLIPADVDPLAVDAFTVGGTALSVPAPDGRKARRSSADDDCRGEVRTLISTLRGAADETAVRDALALARSTTKYCQKEAIDEVAHLLTERTIQETTPAPGREHRVSIKIVREGSPAKEWELILTHSSEGEWRASYGFTFVKNQDRGYFAEAVAGQTGKFEIVKEANRGKADFIPSVFFSWHGAGNRFGPAFGLGYDLESPSLFLGGAWTYRQNIMVTGGLAIHSRRDLKGRYDQGDVIGENLNEDQLTEPTFTPNIYLGAAFRFGSNIHQQRAAALTTLATERNKAADKVAAAKKAEEKQKNDLDVCEKGAETERAKAVDRCNQKPTCIEVANRVAEEEKAKCRLKAVAGEPAEPQPAAPGDRSASPPAGLPRELVEPAAAATPASRRCATPSLTPEARSRVLDVTNRFRAKNFGYAQKTGRLEIPINFHVIHDGTDGRLDQARVAAQIGALNRVFGPLGFGFTLKMLEYTDQPTWFRLAQRSKEEVEAKRTLGRDTDRALNLYSCAPPNYLGWATLPIWLQDYPDYDGVVVHHSTLPGGGAPFDLGTTAVHEVGHWLGLEHTFNGWVEETAPQGGCFAPGDSIDDTAYEASPSFGPGTGRTCPAVGSRDTCPASAGPDPIDNYMDYADDRCMVTFTRGQVAWMKELTAQYRPLLLESASGDIKMFVPAE